MIKINVELTKLSGFATCQKWRHSKSFLDEVTEDKWMFENRSELWLVVNLKDEEIQTLREAAIRSGMEPTNANFLTAKEIIEAVVNEELSKLFFQQ